MRTEDVLINHELEPSSLPQSGLVQQIAGANGGPTFSLQAMRLLPLSLSFCRLGRFTHMKILTPNVRRVIASLLLAVPFGWLASRGFPHSAVRGYIGALALYWLIQACTKYQRPSDGLLVVGFLTVLYVLLLPALGRARV